MTVIKRLLTIFLLIMPTLLVTSSASPAAALGAPVCGTAGSFPEYPPTSLQSAVAMETDLAESDCVAAGDSYLANYPPSSVMSAHADVRTEIANCSTVGGPLEFMRTAPKCTASGLLGIESDSSRSELLANTCTPGGEAAENPGIEGSIVNMNSFMQGAVLVSSAETGGVGQNQPDGDCAFASDSQPAGVSQVNLVSNTCTSGGEAADNPGIEGSIVNMNSFMQGAALVNASETGGGGGSC